MSDYTRVHNFTAKDSLPTGNPSKKVLGSEVDAEFDAIDTAIQSKVDDGTTVTLTSTDAGTAVEPILSLHRNSASPADADFIGEIRFDGEDSGSNQTTYAALTAQIDDVTNATEDGSFLIKTMEGGTLTTQLDISSAGVVVDSDLTLLTGSITSASGAISFGDENLTTSGSLSIGTADTTQGILNLYGHTTGSNNGGEVKLYTAADFDSTIDFFRFKANQDDIRIADNNDTYATIMRGDTGNWEFPSDVTLSSGDLTVTGTGNFTGGTLNIGVDDDTGGVINIRGNGTGSAEGGQINLLLAADHDTSFEHIAIDVSQDDLRIFDNTANYITYMRGDTGNWQFPADVSLNTSGGKFSIGGGTLDYTRTSISGTFTSGGSSTTATSYFDNSTIVGANGDTGFIGAMLLTAQHTTQGNTETVNDVAQLRLDEPNITVGTGDTVTNASTLLVTGAPTEGDNNYAILVDDGDVKFASGRIIVGSDLGWQGNRLGGNHTSTGSSNIAVNNLLDGTITGHTGDNGGIFGTWFNAFTLSGNNSLTIGDIAQVRISEPQITLNGSDTVTNASSLLINGAPTEGVNNYAILVDSGDVRLASGDLTLTTGNLTVSSGFLNIGSFSNATISSGSITATTSYVRLAGEGSTTDTLTDINGGTQGDLLILRTISSGYTITIQAGAGSNKIDLNTTGDFAMDSTQDRLTLLHDGTQWVELSRSSN